ncbi:MAG: hypothetical protein KKE50_03125 [Nanoarchaeota archaeon]|nr:hypothetical protein [Nanoarchaeota archaeon]
MRKRGSQLIYVLGLALILFLLPSSNALGEDYCVVAEVTDISPSSVGIGEEFTVGVQIENCGNKMPEFVSFELITPPVDIVIKEPLVMNISQLYYGNSKRSIIYHMRTNNDAIPGTHIIKTRLDYGKQDSFMTKDGEISFEVIGEKAEIGIASVKVSPVLPFEGDTVELTLRIENSGDGTAKSIKVFADHPFQGVKQTFVGTLESDEDGPAIFTFIADMPGEFEFPVTISYYDDFGEKEVKTNIDLTILKKKSNIGSIVVTIIILGAIGWGIFYFFKVKKSKDKIIQQLLRGNNLKEKK